MEFEANCERDIQTQLKTNFLNNHKYFSCLGSSRCSVAGDSGGEAGVGAGGSVGGGAGDSAECGAGYAIEGAGGAREGAGGCRRK